MGRLGGNPQLAALRLAKPSEFQRKVRAAVEKAGSIPGAAEALGVGRATLFRWIADTPGIIEGIELPAAKAVERGASNPFAAPAKPRGRRAHSAVVHWPGIDPERFAVIALVVRRDGEDLSDEDVLAARAAMPPAEPASGLVNAEDLRFGATPLFKLEPPPSPKKRGR